MTTEQILLCPTCGSCGVTHSFGKQNSRAIKNNQLVKDIFCLGRRGLKSSSPGASSFVFSFDVLDGGQSNNEDGSVNGGGICSGTSVVSIENKTQQNSTLMIGVIGLLGRR